MTGDAVLLKPQLPDLCSGSTFTSVVQTSVLEHEGVLLAGDPARYCCHLAREHKH